jgi:hypothetical protein
LAFFWEQLLYIHGNGGVLLNVRGEEDCRAEPVTEPPEDAWLIRPWTGPRQQGGRIPRR